MLLIKTFKLTKRHTGIAYVHDITIDGILLGTLHPNVFKQGNGEPYLFSWALSNGSFGMDTSTMYGYTQPELIDEVRKRLADFLNKMLE